MASKGEILDQQAKAASALLSLADGHELKAVVFQKAMFYSDLVALRDLGRTITGSAYTAAPLGPMLTNFTKLVAHLKSKRIAIQVSDGDALPIRALLPFSDNLHDDEREIVRMVSARASNWTSTAASDYSHKNIGWIIGRDAPLKRINLVLAMQQLVDDDTWLEEPVTPDEVDAVAQGMSDAVAWR